MPAGSIIPTIRYKDCPAAIDWLQRAFCFETHFIVPGESGDVLHAQLTCGESMIMLGSAHDDDDFGKLHAAPNEVSERIHLVFSWSLRTQMSIVQMRANMAR